MEQTQSPTNPVLVPWRGTNRKSGGQMLKRLGIKVKFPEFRAPVPCRNQPTKETIEIRRRWCWPFSIKQADRRLQINAAGRKAVRP